ncbi:MAG: efflux RND transporter periplasmic adaptor subunit [Gallionellaceae bacterium]|jgi:membrane fusion protein (multidrug efflux system)|nr:efflux RND transporter periplasmic adaptor subunit [Gallionellaceae bacterium]
MEESAKTSAPNGKRKRLLLILFAIVLLAGVSAALWWLIVGRYHETTNDAYVGGNVVQVTPQTSGTVIALSADNTDFVTAGTVLVTLDQADANITLADAESRLAKAVRSVRNLQANAEELAATVELRRADFLKAQNDLARREKIQATGAVSAEVVQHARDALKAARASLTAAEQQLAATRALVDNTTVRNHPDVLNAAAQVRKAWLEQARTKIPAPVTGFVDKRSAQLGQRVAAGSALMSVVPLDQVWVDANFKENQLAHIRPGQPVTLTADLYGDEVKYHGTVAGFGAGTGSAFALLPPQNATGNWIKVVQRLPVRIALDPEQIAAHPLQIGLSMEVDVDTHQRDGKRLQETPPARTYATDVFRPIDAQADPNVEEIFVAFAGK